MTVALALGLGGLVGLALGALGGGGSILAIPALVFVLGQSPQMATTTSLVVVGAGAAGGLASHLLSGNVRVGAGVTFGLVGVVGSLVGTRVNRMIAGPTLLAAFSVLMLAVAVLMWRRGTGSGVVAPPSGADPDDGIGRWFRLAGAGTGVGFLTGLFGVGGGFVIVPALVLTLGFEMQQAVGTSLVVIMVNVVAALAGRADALALNVTVTAWFTLGVMAGSTGGASLTDRLAASKLTRAFAVVLVALAAVSLWRSAPALATAG